MSRSFKFNEEAVRDNKIDDDKLAKSEEITSILELVDLFYKNHDLQKFDNLCKVYTPESLLVWNGIALTGTDNIRQFFIKLPKSVHVVYSIDTQRLEAGEQKKHAIQVSGLVKYENYSDKVFFHTFIISEVGDTYKILQENYRCPDGTP